MQGIVTGLAITDHPGKRYKATVWKRRPLAQQLGDHCQQPLFRLRQQVDSASYHHMFYPGLRQCLGQCVVELVENHHCLGTGVIELVNQLAMGVHRIGVNYHQPQLPGSNHHHWILQQIGQLDGNSISRPQVKAIV